MKGQGTTGFCQCGCGQRTTIAKWTDRSQGRVKGQPLLFIRGHNGKGMGSRNPAWTGGRIQSGGYVLILNPTHARADRHGYVREHILVAERALGRPLPAGATVHHQNEIKSDNANRNLIICQDEAYHQLLHLRKRAFLATGDPNMRRCVYCKEWGQGLNHRKSGAFNHRHCHADYEQRRLELKKSGK